MPQVKITNPHHFGLGPGHLPRKAAAVAHKHGAVLINYTEPNGQKRHWFNCQNMGEPFDSQVAAAVLGELHSGKLVTGVSQWGWTDDDTKESIR